MTAVDKAVDAVWNTKAKLLLIIWITTLLIFIGTMTFMVIEYTQETSRNNEIAKEACRDVNSLNKAMLQVLVVVEQTVDIPAARTQDERTAILDGYDRAFQLLQKAECK
jgi:hypothetical protein